METQADDPLLPKRVVGLVITGDITCINSYDMTKALERQIAKDNAG